MNTKKTLLLTLILAVTLVIGIFIFSITIQYLWQGETETENNIQITSNTTIIEASQSYPYKSILDSEEYITNSFEREFLFENIVYGSDNFASLQEASDKMGELINIIYKPTSLIPSVAYVDYHKLNFPNTPTHIYYFTEVEIGENSFIFHAVLNSLTLEIISCTAFINQPISETAITVDTDNREPLRNTEMTGVALEKTTKAVEDILFNFGYSSEHITQTYQGYNFITITENNMQTDKLMLLYSMSLFYNESNHFVIEFLADENELTLLSFQNFDLQ